MDNQPNGSVGSAPQSQEPVVQSAPVQTQQPMPQQMASPASTSGGSKAMYIVGGIVAAILLVLGSLFFMAMPALQATAKADKFMQAVKANDEKTMQELSGSGRDGVTDKLNAALKTGSYKHTDTKKKDGSFVVSFDVSGAPSVKDAVVVVEKSMISKLLINTKGAATTTEPTATTSAPATAAAGCLTVADLKAADVTNIDSLSIAQDLASFYFKADSTEYDSSYSNDFSLRDIAKTFESIKSKTFTLTVRGSVNDQNASAANDKLANDRAAKVKADLVAKGVSADRITIETPDHGSISTDPVTYRTVVVKVAVPTNCGGDAASSAGR
ncbi:OmpA family protein [Candidatus Saccharibacteria bacterium]|nr:OmpA family protein [Candidatus Saccharibacteria bacterium]